MADGLNRSTLLGNLGSDPELGYTPGGTAYLKMRLATNESYLEKATNTRKELVEWHSVVVWGKRAEALAKLLSKGERLYIEGALRTNSWDDKETGQKRYRTQIVARQVILCGARRAGDFPPAGGEEYEGGRGEGGGYDDPPPPAGEGEDDIPF